MHDALLHEIGLPHEHVFYPLGYPLRISTNSSALLDTASTTWAGFPQLARTPTLDVRIAVSADSARVPQPPVFRAQRHLMTIVSDSGNYAVCDHERAFAFGWLSEAALREPGFVRYYFLEAIAFHLLTQLYVTPVHAACVTRKGHGILLCGDSGAGKSCLAYACSRADWTYCSDNDSWLVRDSNIPVVRGDPRIIRLRESAMDLFPEVSRHPAVRRANGKTAVSLRPGATSFECQVRALVLLARGCDGGCRLQPVNESRVLEVLTAPLASYEESVSRAQAASLHRLAHVPRFELHYNDAREAACALESVLEPA